MANENETSEERDESRIISVLAASNRRSRWTATPLTAIFSLFARSYYDFRLAEASGDVIEINAWCVFGSITFVVPEGTDVQLAGITFLASAESDVETSTNAPSLPKLVITANTVFGKFRVRTPNEDEIAASAATSVAEASAPVDRIGAALETEEPADVASATLPDGTTVADTPAELVEPPVPSASTA
jgi:hypothetical protein